MHPLWGRRGGGRGACGLRGAYHEPTRCAFSALFTGVPMSFAAVLGQDDVQVAAFVHTCKYA